jgi:hypothetical protein
MRKGSSNQWLKRGAAVYAAKKAYDRIQEARKPKRSVWRRAALPALGAAAAAGVGYLAATGKLKPVLGAQAQAG